MKIDISTRRRLTRTYKTSQQDQNYLKGIISTLDDRGLKTNRSELLSLGVALLRPKSLREIEKRLRANRPTKR